MDITGDWTQKLSTSLMIKKRNGRPFIWNTNETFVYNRTEVHFQLTPEGSQLDACIKVSNKK